MSFTDLMQSGRGPGLIGMLLGLLVLAGFGILFMFVFDEGMQGADQSIDSIIRRQSDDIKRLRSHLSEESRTMELASARQAQQKALRELDRENQFRDAQAVTLKNDIGKAQAKHDELVASFEAYKDEYRAFVRAKAKGESIPRLETRKGEVYEGVIFREVSAVGIQVLHSGGQKRIPFEDLPQDLQDRFQFDAGQKAAALAREEEIHKEHESAVAASDAAVSEKAAEDRMKAEEEARQRAVLAIASGKRRIEAIREEIKHLREDIVREAAKPISQAPQMRIKLANKERDLVNLTREVSRLEASSK
jgi:hypothetical protein